MRPHSVFPIGIDDLPLPEVVRLCLELGKFRYVVTPNVDHMCRIYDDVEMRRLYEEADLCVCDSKILQYIATLKGAPVKNVVRGSDLVFAILNEIPKDRRVFVLGSHDDLGPAVSSRFGLRHVGVMSPPFGFEHEAEEMDHVLKAIKAFDASLILLAVGSPRQEIVARHLASILDSGVAVCCGAAVSFAVGDVKRAPRWMSAIGAEWLYRMLQDPKRLLPRYAGNLQIFRKAFLK